MVEVQIILLERKMSFTDLLSRGASVYSQVAAINCKFYYFSRDEPAVEHDPREPCASGNVSRDSGGRDPNSFHPDPSRPAHCCPETFGALPDAEACRGQPHQLPGVQCFNIESGIFATDKSNNLVSSIHFHDTEHERI